MKKQIVSIVITTLIGFSAIAGKIDGTICDQGEPNDAITLSSAKKIVLLIKNKKINYNQVETGTIEIMKNDYKVNKMFLETPTKDDWEYVAVSFLGIDNDKELISIRNDIKTISLNKAAKEFRLGYWFNLCD